MRGVDGGFLMELLGAPGVLRRAAQATADNRPATELTQYRPKSAPEVPWSATPAPGVTNGCASSAHRSLEAWSRRLTEDLTTRARTQDDKCAPNVGRTAKQSTGPYQCLTPELSRLAKPVRLERIVMRHWPRSCRPLRNRLTTPQHAEQYQQPWPEALPGHCGAARNDRSWRCRVRREATVEASVRSSAHRSRP